MLLDDPGMFWPPGSMANSESFSYPVQFGVVKELTPQRVLEPQDITLESSIIDTALKLREKGVQVIVGGCGYLIKYQEAVRSTLDIPVALSSLIQIPWILQCLPIEQDLLIITAVSGQITKETIEQFELGDKDRILITSINQDSELHKRTQDSSHKFDINVMEKFVVETAINSVRENTSIGMILLECSEFPPYRNAVRVNTGLPVFDYLTLVDYLASSFTHPSFR